MNVSRVNQSLSAWDGYDFSNASTLALGILRVDRNIDVGLAESAIPLRNLVLEHDVVDGTYSRSSR